MQKRVYSVGQINGYIRNLFDGDYLLSNLCIKGEVSNCKYHSSGHIYFSLKDEKGAMNCVMFRSSRSGLGFRLQDGQSVIVTGTISVYEKDGRYQLYAKAVQLDGAGALYEEYERLKNKLYEEGLFEFEIKKPIPKYPKRVGIVTAATGAAIQDIRNIAKRRNPYVQLILYPAKVQGEGAAQTIVKGIQILDNMQVDTIIIGRGGGSIEDLWAFNEECVARAIYEARTPIISGTGHEVDTTIVDYAADLRAPTPSAACELAIPDYMSMCRELADMQNRIQKQVQHKAALARGRWQELSLRLKHLNPQTRLSEKRIYLDELSDRMRRAMDHKLERYQHQYALLAERLHGCSPTAKLINGYGYIEAQGAPLRRLGQVKPGDSLTVTIHDGQLQASITSLISMEEFFSSEGGD